MDCGPEAHTMAGEATRAWTDIRPFSGAGKGLIWGRYGSEI